ncbi:MULTISPECIES: carboxylate-amine ligase [Nocardiopsis]|uniref:Putative glutamate--cysteine ligase 2 n=1 Tax=Nocardiopsis sinuspersici TaxID=501010 RepID=A0A1V3C6E1_9ACTN|nr:MULTISPECIES: glutamate--cysteine ligase [Nocardiopsis]OOC56354.1 glutamate--cysteine ligase [Nocardiopsis sinuspersici]
MEQHSTAAGNRSTTAHGGRPASADTRAGNRTAPPTFGVEEEFFVVDPRTRGILSRGSEVLADARLADGRPTGEFSRAQVEANTPVCDGAGEALRSLRAAREEFGRSAGAAGLSVVASGTPVLGDPASALVSEDRRYTRIAAHVGALREALVVCGCHVHVGIPDRETAVAVSDHLRRWLPFLLAVSANSPFHAGRDTGYASWRTVTWNRLPSAGPPPLLRSPAEHDRIVRALADTGAILDQHMVYWDIRPSDHLPTLEIRVGDVAATAEEALLLACLTRGLAAGALTDVHRGVPAPDIPDHALRAAVWRAARDGLEGVVPDPLTGEALPGASAADRLLHAALPGLLTNGDADLTASLLDRVRVSGTGAARQRAVHARRGSLADVVDHLVAETREGLA